MKNQQVLRDERYYAVENASYKIGYMICAYGLLLLVVIRSLVYQESNWDLMALVIVSSAATTIYQFRHKTIQFSRQWIYVMLGSAILAAVIAYAAGTLMR